MKKDNYTVLVVDDDFISYLLIKEMLSPFKIDLLYANCGSSAIKTCINNDDISLIFMDIKMKGMNGFETASFIKGFRKNVPIVFQTAYAEEFSHDAFMIQIGSGYIEKPIKKTTLMNEVNKYLNLEIKKTTIKNEKITFLNKKISFGELFKKLNFSLSFNDFYTFL